MDFDGFHDLNPDGSVGSATKAMTPGSYRTLKSTNAYGWRHWRQYIDDNGATVNQLWIPRKISIPALIH